MSNSSHFGECDRFSQLSDEFMCWLKQSAGVRVSPKIKIADLRSEGAGRGIVASSDITEDEELFAIPQNVVLSFRNSKLKDILHISESDLGPWLCLILVMIYEYLQGGASPWSRYFQVLPTEFDTLMFWTDEELRELSGSAVLNKIGKSDAEAAILRDILPIVSRNPHLFPPISGLGSYDSPDGKATLLSLAHRMGSLIMAYAFDIEKGEDEEGEGQDGYVTDEEEQELPKGMVPLADLLNADADRNNARLFQEDGYLAMKSIKPIRNEEEIFNDYGELPRADLLRRYGYVTDNYAQYDEAEISMQAICKAAGIQPTTPDPEQPRLEFLENLGVFDDGYGIPRPNTNTPLMETLPEELLIALNTLTMPPEQFNEHKMKNKAPKPILGVMQATLLGHAVHQTLGEYITTLEQDKQLLATISNIQASTVSGRRFMMALQVRMGEKEILSQLLAALAEFITLPDAYSGMKRSMELSVASDEKRRKI
ncbi:SET domain-containing protein 6 [Blastomyces silverae]|uniref:SET domain-containing protein 6 n=1 Tax=Blastomyces silverae TaxID=2060906 RepID=A0A0H1BUG2_9EURO|nr:SET domain-containing protein 6 [Blastomyces silverae]